MNQSHIKLNASIFSYASAVGKKEFDGPLGQKFDLHDPDGLFGKKTWESAESEMQRMAFAIALSKAKLKDVDVGALFAGDLLNQCVGSAYGLLSFDVPYFGLYGACSTSAESLLLASMTITLGAYKICGAVTSSHYCSAERQYRTPIEYGAQRPPTAQWTVTGAGAFLVGSPQNYPDGVRITAGMPGKAQDYGINDANNMGAAMAPAVRDTLHRYFASTGTSPEDYDKIVKLHDSPANTLCLCTGSLGSNPENDIPSIIRHFGEMDRIGAMHVRNVKILGYRHFREAAHLSSTGDLDMFAIMKAIYDTCPDTYIRPDHGRMIWDEQGRPGYGLYDRALGATYLNGLWEAIQRMDK